MKDCKHIFKSYHRYFVKNFNITNILLDIQDIIFLFEGTLLSNILHVSNEINIHRKERKKGEKRGFPNCCILFYIFTDKSTPCSINQILAIKKMEPDNNGIPHYFPCEECAVKILNCINTIK